MILQDSKTAANLFLCAIQISTMLCFSRNETKLIVAFPVAEEGPLDFQSCHQDLSLESSPALPALCSFFLSIWVAPGPTTSVFQCQHQHFNAVPIYISLTKTQSSRKSLVQNLHFNLQSWILLCSEPSDCLNSLTFCVNSGTERHCKVSSAC